MICLTAPINHQIRYYFDFDSCSLVMNGENGLFTSYALNANFDSSSSRSIRVLCRKVFRRTSTTSIYSCILLSVLDGCIVLSPYHTVILSFRLILQLSSSRKHSDFSSETPSRSSGLFWYVSQYFIICILQFSSAFSFGVSIT